MSNKRYKVSINLDRILAKNKYSKMQFSRDSNINYGFINQLTQQKEVANLDKLVDVLNALNAHGLDVKPSDLITFEPLGKTKIEVLASQHKGNQYTFFFEFKYQKETYKDLISLVINQDKTNIKITARANEANTFSPEMQKAIFAQSFYLGQGVDKMVAIVEKDKKVVAQLLSKALISQALKDKVISLNSHVNIIKFNYFDTFDITFHNAQFKNGDLVFTKDSKDSIKPNKYLGMDAYKATYPFHRPSSTGKIDKK